MLVQSAFQTGWVTEVFAPFPDYTYFFPQGLTLWGSSAGFVWVVPANINWASNSKVVLLELSALCFLTQQLPWRWGTTPNGCRTLKKSQNSKIAEIGRDPWVHQAQLLLRQAHPEQRAQDHVPVAFGDVQGRAPIASGQSVPALCHLHRLFFLMFKRKLLCSNLCPPPLVLHWASLSLQFSPGCRQAMWSRTSSRKEKEKDLKYFPTLAFEKYWLFHCNGVLLGACSAAPSSSSLWCFAHSIVNFNKEKKNSLSPSEKRTNELQMWVETVLWFLQQWILLG